MRTAAFWKRAGAQEAGLGKLLPFDQLRRVPRDRPPGQPEGRVLMFTGVRYQRGDTPVPHDGSTPARPKRKRG